MRNGSPARRLARGGRLCLLLAALLACPSYAADPKPTFTRSQIDMAFSRFETADVDGDGLSDLLLIAKDGLHVLLQSAEGFSLQRQVTYTPPDKCVALWPARIGPDRAACVLMLTPEGLSSLHVSQAGIRDEKLIECKTAIPDGAEREAIFFPLAVKTSGDYPLLLVPTDNALEIWRYESDGWRQTGTIPRAMQSTVTGPNRRAGYQLFRFANLAVGDLNGDGRDDLVVRQALPQRDVLRLKVYEQDASGRFADEPSRQVDTPCDWYEWVCLQDMNHDGRPDLVKNTWVRYPLVLPGRWSGKVIVRVYLAGRDGKWSDEPTCVFRKHDWHAPVPIVDLDGDGNMDLVLGFYQWKGRDEMVESIETERLQFDLRVHMFDPATGYPAEPTFVTRISAYVHAAGFHIDWDLFSQGFNLEGDFNGDGRKDLLVRESKTDLSVRFFQSRQAGFSKKADLHFPIDPDRHVRMVPEDLNGDGISDLIVMSQDQSSLIVFTSRRK